MVGMPKDIPIAIAIRSLVPMRPRAGEAIGVGVGVGFGVGVAIAVKGAVAVAVVVVVAAAAAVDMSVKSVEAEKSIRVARVV